ncbi:hypothetical protein, partial [Mycobacterium angelicum]|uniref:hypothetical protein n=1 Tax=Mycobacterium angelicum TaxID=470074 RepID=UPI0021F371D1
MENRHRDPTHRATHIRHQRRRITTNHKSVEIDDIECDPRSGDNAQAIVDRQAQDQRQRRYRNRDVDVDDGDVDVHAQRTGLERVDRDIEIQRNSATIGPMHGEGVDGQAGDVAGDGEFEDAAGAQGQWDGWDVQGVIGLHQALALTTPEQPVVGVSGVKRPGVQIPGIGVPG